MAENIMFAKKKDYFVPAVLLKSLWQGTVQPTETRHSKSDKALLLVAVIVGRAADGWADATAAPDGYDSLVDNTIAPTIFVVQVEEP